MYRHLTASEFISHIGLPEDYHVDGLLASGTWDINSEDRHLPFLHDALVNLGLTPQIKRLEYHLLAHTFEVKVEDKVYWFTPVMGTAIMSQYAHIASSLGSKINILVGVAGGLSKGMKVGDFILPTASRGNESAAMYQRDVSNSLYFPNTQVQNQLKSNLSQELKLEEGLTQTCETLFGERIEDVQKWSSEEYLGVEMEAALIFALSDSFGIPAGALLYVADNLIEEETMLSLEYKSAKEIRNQSRQAQYEAAVKVLLSY